MMLKLFKCLLLLGVSVTAGLTLLADSFKLTDGTTYDGRPSSFSEEGVVIKLDAGGFSPRVPWTKVPQDTLKALSADPRAKRFAEPFIDIPAEARVQKAKEKEIVLKPFPKADYYAKKPGIISAFTTPAGLLLLAVVLAASIYAGYEVAVYKRHPAAVVCGVSAIIPIIGPVLFLFVPSMGTGHTHEYAPTNDEPVPDQRPDAATMAQHQQGGIGVPSGGGLSVAKQGHGKSGSGVPDVQVFKKPEITFNRRFFETRFTGFFRIVPSEAEKDLVLLFRCGRTEFTAKRISRITMNDMHVALISGAEQPIAFGDITEVQIRHKDAK